MELIFGSRVNCTQFLSEKRIYAFLTKNEIMQISVNGDLLNGTFSLQPKMLCLFFERQNTNLFTVHCKLFREFAKILSLAAKIFLTLAKFRNVMLPKFFDFQKTVSFDLLMFLWNFGVLLRVLRRERLNWVKRTLCKFLRRTPTLTTLICVLVAKIQINTVTLLCKETV